jgi:hypothetical protein
MTKAETVHLQFPFFKTGRYSLKPYRIASWKDILNQTRHFLVIQNNFAKQNFKEDYRLSCRDAGLD